MVMKKKVNISTSRMVNGDRIAFSLTPVSSRLSKGKKTFRARVRTRGTLSMADIATEMAAHVGAGDISTCRYYLALLHEIIAEKTMAGYRLKTEFFETGLSIRGTFDSVDDEFDSERHELLPTVCATKAFKKAVAAAEVLNVSRPLKARVISLMDAVTKSLNAFAGRNEVHLQGDGLGICTDNPDEGVFLSAKDKTVAVAKVLKSDAQTISCRFDEPPSPGKYDLMVRCRNGADSSFAPAEAFLRNVVVTAAPKGDKSALT